VNNPQASGEESWGAIPITEIPCQSDDDLRRIPALRFWWLEKFKTKRECVREAINDDSIDELSSTISVTFFSAQGTPVSSLPHSHLPPLSHPIPSVPSHPIASCKRQHGDIDRRPTIDLSSRFAQHGVPGCVPTAASSLASSQLNKGLQPPEIKPHQRPAGLAPPATE
jgi:hypothetical protein